MNERTEIEEAFDSLKRAMDDVMWALTWRLLGGATVIFGLMVAAMKFL